MGEQVVWLIEVLKPQWPLASYDILRCNCCHFCQEFCQKLGVGAFPDWVASLAIRGAALAAGSAGCCCQADAQVIENDAHAEDWREFAGANFTEMALPWREEEVVVKSP